MHPLSPKYANLRILNLAESTDVKRLRFLLSDVFKSEDLAELDNESYFLKEEVQLRPAASRVAELLLPHNVRSLQAQSVIIESDYVDRDSNIAYALLYARAFRDYPRRTIRLHFFRNPLTSYDELLDEQILQESYVGFCVLSSTQPGNIGRTVLPPPKGDNTWFFVPTQSEFSVNLSGVQLFAKGTAFIQQDGRVAACASAATWMSTIILSRRFNFEMPIRSMAEITQLATKYSFPPIWGGSRPGLAIEQILWALHEMGYEPISHEVLDPEMATEIIYSYVESGIPPILVILLPSRGLHAVTVVGHTYNPSVDAVREIATDIRSVTAWCPYFITHDDQMGPYLKLRIAPPNSQSNKRPRLFIDETDSLLGCQKGKITEWYRNATLHYVIAPLPPRHALRPEEAAAKGKAILIKAYDLYKSFLARRGTEMPANPIFRSYFIASNEFKRRFLPGKVQGLSPELASWYRGSIYPRFVWVTELCALQHRNVKNPQDLRIVADVTIDPTSSPFSVDFVTLHLPYLFFRMLPRETNAVSALRAPVGFIQNDQPYQPLVRMEAGYPPIITSP